MHPVILDVGPLTIYSLGVFWALGGLTAVWILQQELNRNGYAADLATRS